MLVSTMAVQGLEPAASPWGSIGRTLVGLLVHFMITTSSVMCGQHFKVSAILTSSSQTRLLCSLLLGALLTDSQMMIHCCCCRCLP